MEPVSALIATLTIVVPVASSVDRIRSVRTANASARQARPTATGPVSTLAIIPATVAPAAMPARQVNFAQADNAYYNAQPVKQPATEAALTQLPIFKTAAVVAPSAPEPLPPAVMALAKT